MKKLIILDASTTEVHVYSLPNNQSKTTEDVEAWILANTQHRLSECSWMILPTIFQFTVH